ncbi:MAG: glycosyltransferase [Alphaproteobacteria bacterium]
MSPGGKSKGAEQTGSTSPGSARRIAVLLPCLNEAAAIAHVVEDFRKALPTAEIFVYDNASTDDTAEVAAGAGAIVRKESVRGKGYVVRRMFADIDADIYLMADGDGTYDAASAPRLIEAMLDGPFDMVVGVRKDIGAVSRSGHGFGNRLFNRLLTGFFGRGFEDIFSGYRAFSNRFAKTFPASAKGFEIETEMSVHALELQIPVCEISLPYRERIHGGESKLRTYQDGLRILLKMILMLKDVRPLFFFSSIAAAFFVLSVALAAPILIEYFETGLVPRFPTAILASAIGILGFISLTSGVILDNVARGNRQIKRMMFLSAGSAPDRGN